MQHAPQHSLQTRHAPTSPPVDPITTTSGETCDWPRVSPLYALHPYREAAPDIARVGTGLFLMCLALAAGFGLAWVNVAKKQSAVEAELQRLQEEVMLLEARSPSENVDGSGAGLSDRAHLLSPTGVRIPLNVYSSPSGALVSIDGVEVGTTPLLAHFLDPGAYIVSAASGKTSREQVVVMLESDGPKRLSFDLRNGAPTRNASSRPQRAAQKPPAANDSGEPHATPQTRSPQSAGPAEDPTAHARGGLQVGSSPPGATVLISGREVGTTPIDIPDAAPGVYTVAVSMKGYEPWTSRVHVEADRRVVIHAELTPQQKKARFGW